MPAERSAPPRPHAALGTLVLSHLTFTGADDSVDPDELARLSAAAPLIEWGVLWSAEPAGRPRFPSAAWRRAFYAAAPRARRAAHLCGEALLSDLALHGLDASHDAGRELRGDGLAPPTAGAYQRLQLNFDAGCLPPAIQAAWAGAARSGAWRTRHGERLGLVTQHNAANAHLHLAFGGSPGHAVLFDASGGQGQRPDRWPAPLAGVDCGYAGGLGPHTLAAELPRIAAAAGGRTTWIDMEGALRDGDRFDLDRVRGVLDHLQALAGGAALIPGVLLVLPLVAATADATP